MPSGARTGHAASMNALPNTRSCYVCGIENPIGLRLGFQSDDARTVAETRFSFRPEFAGFRDTVHGGAIATVLDEVMVWAIGVAAKQFVYCAELTVRYQRPARPGAELVARGEVTEDRRGRLFIARGELRDASGQLLAESTGKYLPVPAAVGAQVLEDFVGEVPEFLQRATVKV